MMNLLGYYEEAIVNGQIIEDALQKEILVHMQRLDDELKTPQQSSWWPWHTPPTIRGLYIHGPVGAGKTYLVDLFFHAMSEQKKLRFHFHHFMQQIDAQLRLVQGQKDPLRHIAKTIAKSTRVLCFDEFLVNDVAYAMILAELLQALFKEGVILIVSSNTPPDELYLNGVQRQRFLPAIDLINQHCEVLHLNEKQDYRIGREPLLETYLHPLDAHSSLVMEEQFNRLSQQVQEEGFIRVQSRDIAFLKCSEKSIWFHFEILCNLPRSQLDYLEIADRFDNLFISNIPRLTEHHTAQTIMFIHCIDVMYDRGIKIILSAEVPLQELYVAGEMKYAFERTYSRLVEMQSIDYLSRHPKREVSDIIK